jgi:hypothetical protein
LDDFLEVLLFGSDDIGVEEWLVNLWRELDLFMSEDIAREEVGVFSFWDFGEGGAEHFEDHELDIGDQFIKFITLGDHG